MLCCIYATSNNHFGICGFLKRSSIQQSKFDSSAFCKDIVYLENLLPKSRWCAEIYFIIYGQAVVNSLLTDNSILSHFPQILDMSAMLRLLLYLCAIVCVLMCICVHIWIMNHELCNYGHCYFSVTIHRHYLGFASLCSPFN